MAPRDEDITADDAPTSIDPYEVLSLPKEATADEVKSAYRKAALRHHPDKASEEDKETAHTKFQEVAFAYAILSDPRRRSRYDTTGRTEESVSIDDDDFNWGDFFRAQYKEVVNSAAIAKFKEEYQGSDEERQAVLEAYTEGEGDMDVVYETVMLSNVIHDDERFRMIIDDAIGKGEVEGFRKYAKESKASKNSRRAKAQREELEARDAARELGVEDELFGNATVGGKTNGKGARKGKADAGGEDALAAIIKRRQQGREEDFFANLEAKYAPKGKKRKEAAPDEPPEEAFIKNAKKGKSAKNK